MNANQITVQRTKDGFTAAFAPLDIVASGRTEDEARARAADDVSRLLSTTAPAIVLERCVRHFEAKARMLEWITSPDALAVLGRPFALRIEILAALRGGNRTLASIAAEYGVTPQAVSRLKCAITTKGC